MHEGVQSFVYDLADSHAGQIFSEQKLRRRVFFVWNSKMPTEGTLNEHQSVFLAL